MKHYLITHQSRTTGGQEILATNLIRIHPADWLLLMAKEYTSQCAQLIYSIEITPKQFESMKEHFCID